MNVATLKEVIKDLPDSMDVLLKEKGNDVRYFPVTLVKTMPIDYVEASKEEIVCTEECLILSNEEEEE